MVLALALAEVKAGGFWGKVTLPDGEGTSNVGVVAGPTGGAAGDATNVVTDFVHVKGESRSHDPKVFRQITAAYKQAFANAAAAVTDDAGKKAKVQFLCNTDYQPFRLKDTTPVVQAAVAGVRGIGQEPVVRVANGGLDANWFVRHGIPTVTFGAGQNEIHTVNEWVDLVEYERGCELAVTLATAG
jgi:tripeptide aminopeptidase